MTRPSATLHPGLGSLDIAFLAADSELSRLYKACCQAFENFDGLVDAFGVDDPMASVAAVQIESLLRAYQQRLKTIQEKQSAKGATPQVSTGISARVPRRYDHPAQDQKDNIAVNGPALPNKYKKRAAAEQDHTDLILWAAFSWWQSWKDWQQARLMARGERTQRLCREFNPSLRMV